MSKKTNIIHSLTSLRMLAALGVFVSHLGILSLSSIPQFHEVSRYFFNGYVGVTFFYILSGFIINYSFNKNIASGEFSKKDFIVHRLARLFPVHLVSLLCVLFLFGYTANFEAVNKEALVYNSLLLHAFIPDVKYYFSFNPVSWSISCEMFFYACFCLLVKVKTRYLVFVLFAILAISIYSMINPLFNVTPHWLFYINPFFRIGDFIIGVIICRVFIDNPVKPKVSVCSAMEVLSLASLALTIYLATNHISNMNVKYDLLYIPCMAFIVIAFSFNNGFISKLLSGRYFILLGEASFSFYMFHWMVISKLIEIINPEKDDAISVITYIFACLALSIAISIVSFKFIEMPANRLIRAAWSKLSSREKKAESAA
ncbi:acyltransferase [Enterobacter sp. Ag1]|uniref:acyltransferase family protein n=2 Tax=Enterobacteriaceae TaxID=543 RepID=UPI000272A51D|nr:acyltransferase [Enterobacter sp. Ag1]EJF29911.1 acyltransferase 3 [Enterobacter sp. Ag1]